MIVMDTSQYLAQWNVVFTNAIAATWEHTAAIKSCLSSFSCRVKGMFLTLRRVRETLKLGLRNLVFFSSAARLRLLLSVVDMLSQAADPSSIVPSLAYTMHIHSLPLHLL